MIDWLIDCDDDYDGDGQSYEFCCFILSMQTDL